ncbi:MAG TPA: UdgX family uracil-DNA binding protein [Actinomycetota bacterium]|nr:UdgX family uracil-DNA binding protein [Actinomycetota bacterium]
METRRSNRRAESQAGDGTAAALIPPRPSLGSLRRAAAACTACELFRDATQTVFGEGGREAALMLVGEQPGDREDREGRPFVGPAGRLLERALEDAGIDRDAVYVTNAVKHFRFEQRGKRRIHRRPGAAHLRACRPWLEAEIAVVRPDVLLCLGSTAAEAVIGRGFRVTEHRGTFVDTPLEPLVTATVHPSSILRAPDDLTRHVENEAFVRDLTVAAGAIAR